MRALIYVLTLATLSFSCSKNKVNTGESVEIYLLEKYQTVAGKCQIDPSVSVLQNTATIKNQDILEYSTANHKFTLSDPAIQKVKAFRDFTPFAVTIDKRVIYYGFFKPAISSSSCNNSITMDVDWTTGNKISLNLGTHRNYKV